VLGFGVTNLNSGRRERCDRVRVHLDRLDRRIRHVIEERNRAERLGRHGTLVIDRRDVEAHVVASCIARNRRADIHTG
jgi:hypothetical protein